MLKFHRRVFSHSRALGHSLVWHKNVDFKTYLNLKLMQLVKIERFLIQTINRPLPPYAIKLINRTWSQKASMRINISFTNAIVDLWGSTSYRVVPGARALGPEEVLKDQEDGFLQI